MAEIERTHGRLDGLVNNAGIGTPGDIEHTSFAEWRRVMAVNADGVFLGCKHAMPLLAKSKAPSIVNISSASGIVGGANLAAYNASKGAVRLLTKSVALYGARKRPPVRCNSVHPAFIDGDMVDADRAQPARPGQGARQAAGPDPHRPPRPTARGGEHGGVAAVGGLVVHDGVGGAGRRRPDRGVNRHLREGGDPRQAMRSIRASRPGRVNAGAVELDGAQDNGQQHGNRQHVAHQGE